MIRNTRMVHGAGLVLIAIVGFVVMPQTYGASEVRGVFSADGVTGRPAATPHGWDREKVYIHQAGTGGFGAGTDSSWDPRGWFSIRPVQQFPAGTYSMYTFNYDGVAAFDYRLNVDLPAGSGVVDNVNFRSVAHYSVMYNLQPYEWAAEPWIHGTNFYQTFIATTSSITRVATVLADKRPSYTALVLNYAIYRTNDGAPSTWTQISPIRNRFLSANTDPIIHIFDVQYRSNEVALTVGQRYAVRYWIGEGSTSTDFSIVARPDSGNGYAQGQAYIGDTPQPGWDIYGFISGGAEGTIVNHAPSVNMELVNLMGWTPSCGQTFVASGNGLAGVEYVFTVGCDGNPVIPITFTLYNSVGGTPIGPSKIVYGVGGFCQARAAAFWEPGLISLTPGQKYYIEMTTPGGANPWRMQEDIPGVEAYINRASRAPDDLMVIVAEYGVVPTPGSPTPTFTLTPTPTPILQPNLLLNGDMEQGTTGTGGAAPDNWTKWTGSGGPSFWYNVNYGRNDTRAPRLIGGAINGNTFDAGWYQRVSGLVPGRTYGLTGWVRNVPGLSSLYMTWIGYDLTGQTSNGAAATVRYTEVGGTNAFAQMPLATFQATGDAVTIWMRARNTSASQTFYGDFDDLILYDLGAAGQTPTPTVTNTPPIPDTDGDGILDNVEGAPPSGSQTNAWLNDSDGDGLSDGAEDANKNGVRNAGETDPRNKDTDGDNWIDGLDEQPQNPAQPGTAVDADTDELPSGVDLNESNPDSDGDRFKDGYEAAKLGLFAAYDPANKPQLGDVNRDGFVTSLDALVIQSLFLQLIGPDAAVFRPQGEPVGGYVNSDANRDGYVTSLDALVVQSFFLQILALLPI